MYYSTVREDSTRLGTRFLFICVSTYKCYNYIPAFFTLSGIPRTKPYQQYRTVPYIPKTRLKEIRPSLTNSVPIPMLTYLHFHFRCPFCESRFHFVYYHFPPNCV